MESYALLMAATLNAGTVLAIAALGFGMAVVAVTTGLPVSLA